MTHTLSDRYRMVINTEYINIYIYKEIYRSRKKPDIRVADIYFIIIVPYSLAIRHLRAHTTVLID